MKSVSILISFGLRLILAYSKSDLIGQRVQDYELESLSDQINPTGSSSTRSRQLRSVELSGLDWAPPGSGHKKGLIKVWSIHRVSYRLTTIKSGRFGPINSGKRRVAFELRPSMKAVTEFVFIFFARKKRNRFQSKFEPFDDSADVRNFEKPGTGLEDFILLSCVK